MDYKGSVNRMNSKIKSDKTRVDTSWRVYELISKQVVSSIGEDSQHVPKSYS